MFISKKLSKSGKRFGFIRFAGVVNCDSLIIQLHEVWSSSYKLFSSLPRSLENKARVSQSTGFSTGVHCDVNVKSYANEVRGSANDTKYSKNIEEIIELTFGDFIVGKKKQTTCLVKARDFSMLPKLRVLCLDEGFDNFEIRYIRGLWVLIEFNFNNACKNFMCSTAIDHWISENRAWDQTFVPL